MPTKEVLPTKDQFHESPSFTSENMHSSVSTEIAVWHLEASATKPLDLRSLSWDNKPPRVSSPEVLKISPGHDTSTEEFLCPQMSLQTFEIGCAREPCVLDFWQDSDHQGSNQTGKFSL